MSFLWNNSFVKGLTCEYPSTWELEDVKKWKESAANVIKSYYQSFRGSQWDAYMIGSEDEKLLQAKICFALFGPPTVEKAEEIWDGYTSEQQESAKEILQTLLETHKKAKPKSDKILTRSIIVMCKQEEVEFMVPLFSVFTGSDPFSDCTSRSYIDNQRRVYSSWDDWLANNTLPMLKYAVPRYGFYSCSEKCSYEFDPDKDPQIRFETSPACNITSRIFGTTDTVAAITSFGCGIIAVASMMTPIAPIVMTVSAVGGFGSASYGATRATYRILDKGKHGESLNDLESWTLYFSLAAMPLHVASSVVNANLIKGAVENGRTFTSSIRMAATVLNFSVLGVDSIMIGLGLTNMIEKYKKDQLGPLDLLQFSMSVFFFTNTLIKPQMASKIIQNAQDTHIQNYANQMTDAETQATFKKFLADNKGDGTITDNSKIIRTINRITDPSEVFGGLKDASSLKIGGRKGKTFLVGDKKNNVYRLRSKDLTFVKTITQGVEITQGTSATAIRKDTAKFMKKIGAEKIDVNGVKVFDNPDNITKSRINKTIGGTAGKNELILAKAVDLSRDMNLNSGEDVLSMVEILAAKLKKDHPNTQMKDITATQLNQSIDNKSFLKTVQNDLDIATRIAGESDLKFRNDLLAVYHYQKHGEEFLNIMSRQEINIYLTEVPDYLIREGNLVRVETMNDTNGNYLLTKNYYITPQDQFAVVVECPDGGLVSKEILTMFQNDGSYQKFTEGFATKPENLPFIMEPGTGMKVNLLDLAMQGVTKEFVQNMGFANVNYPVIINVNSHRIEVNLHGESEE